jgi:hypothetical protein
MERGEITDFVRVGQACVFEGLIASPPAGTSLIKEKFYERNNNWTSALKLWRPNDLPLKSLIDSTVRLGIATDVITFLSEEAVEPIYQWLLRKGVTCPVTYYEDVESYEVDLRYNRAIRVVYVSNQEHARTLGMRATVVPPTTAWRT